jgi:RNA polymerase sigma-70 factor (ECF subfamily)
MPKAPNTSPTLLLRLRDPHDQEAWGEFVDRYGPVVFAYGCRQGLQEADAADLTQLVFRRVTTALSRFDYDPGAGSFRGWLFTIVRNQLRSLHRQPGGLRLASGDPATERLLAAHPAPEESADWEESCEAQLFRWAARRIRGQFRPASWQAFWRTAVDGRPPEEVAGELGMSVAAVYTARSRVMTRLRAVIQQAQDE